MIIERQAVLPVYPWKHAYHSYFAFINFLYCKKVTSVHDHKRKKLKTCQHHCSEDLYCSFLGYYTMQSDRREAVWSSGILVPTYYTKWHNNPKDCNMSFRWCENTHWDASGFSGGRVANSDYTK